MNYKKTKFKIIFLTIIFFGLFGLAKSSQAAGELSVANVFRITHPAYTITNIWQGNGFGGPWNKDNTRILIYENSASNPQYPGVTGRGFVWGNLDTLKNLGGGEDYQGSLTDYQNNTHALPDNFAIAPLWSVFPGEESIIYALNTDTKYLVKYNVNTSASTNIASYDCTSPCSGQSLTNPQISGWTANNTLIVQFGGTASWSAGWEINVSTGAKTYWSNRPSSCSANGWYWPHAKSVHGDRSPDKLYILLDASQTGGASDNDYVHSNCWPDPYSSPSEYQFSISPLADTLDGPHWNYSNDWLIIGNLNTYSGSNAPTAPYVATWGEDQVYFDRNAHTYTYNKFLTYDTAGYWMQQSSYSCAISSDCDSHYPFSYCYKSKCTQDMNYHGLPKDSLRKDGKQLMFMSTGGVYSIDDYNYNNTYTPYGAIGMFLADLSSASQPDTTPPTAPTGLSVM